MFAIEGSGWLISKIRLPYHRKVKQFELDFVHKANLHGYVICTFTPWQLGNLFIGGRFGHIEMLVGSGKSIGAHTDGVHEKLLKDILPLVGRYAILKPKFATDAERQSAVDRAIEIKNLGPEYDFEFDRLNNKVYCSEIIQEGYREHLLDRYGKIIRPTEFYDDKDIWEVVFEVDTIPKYEPVERNSN